MVFFAEYKKHYEKDHKTKVMDIFQKLNEIHPSPNGCRMVLFIRAIRENESGDDVVIDDFDCDDKDVFLMCAAKRMILMVYIPLHRQLMQIYWDIM